MGEFTDLKISRPLLAGLIFILARSFNTAMSLIIYSLLAGLAAAVTGNSLRGVQMAADSILGMNSTAVVAFADAQWDCTTVSCTSRVPPGTFQPGA